MTIKIDGRSVGPDAAPLVVAELSGNHNGSLERALRLVDAAAAAGAHAIKIQTYTAASMTLDRRDAAFIVADPASPWAGRSLHDLYEEAHTPWNWHAEIFARARALGLIAFSSPFDAAVVDSLEGLGAPCYKIASFENGDLDLIRRVAATGKPLIISTGLATLAELDEAVATARMAGCGDLVLLKCTSAYPAPVDAANLRTIPHLRALFGCEVGLSDHTPGLGAAVAAVALGATVIEKHLTLARGDGGVDAAFSLEPDELASLVVETERAWRSLGGVVYGPTQSERGSLQFRRSLHVVADIRAGERITGSHVRAIRPGHGLPPRFLGAVLGRQATRDLAQGTALTWELLNNAT